MKIYQKTYFFLTINVQDALSYNDMQIIIH